MSPVCYIHAVDWALLMAMSVVYLQAWLVQTQILLLIWSCTACARPAQIAALLSPGFILNTILCQQTFGSASEYVGTHVAPTNVEPMTCCIWADALPCLALPG